MRGHIISGQISSDNPIKSVVNDIGDAAVSAMQYNASFSDNLHHQDNYEVVDE